MQCLRARAHGRRSTSFNLRMKLITAASRSATEANEPCLRTRRCRILNQISTWFIDEA